MILFSHYGLKDNKMKNRYFLEIAFNGTHFHGWQIQPSAVTVQKVLNDHLSILLGEKVNCTGCGRTDAGVHARSYFCHFDVQKPLSDYFLHEINSFLPKDILVRNVFENKAKIHARWDALSRSYEYLISKGKNPFYTELAAVEYWELDLEAMNNACEILKKHVDFSTFSKTHSGSQHHLCDIKHAEWVESEEFYHFRITANRFVRGMVRLLTGTLLLVGKGKMSIEAFDEAISSKDRSKAGKSMPANGLYFTNAEFPDGALSVLKS